MEIFRQITANNIELREYPFLKELAMEAYLMENEDILKLDSDNFADVNILDAEIALKAGRKTSNKDGRIDLLAGYGIDYLSIVELKINEINDSTLNQLEDYLNERNQIVERYPEYWTEEVDPKWVGVLIGSSISPELQRKLQDGYQTPDGIPIAGMVVRRFRSDKGEIFVITDTFFKYNYSVKDKSKFIFNGLEYNKSRLVNKVIRTYVEDHPDLTYSELERLMPKNLQGSKGTFESLETAQLEHDRTGYKRHYVKPNEVIRLSDTTIATSNQWGIDNIMNFVDHINSLEWRYKISG